MEFVKFSKSVAEVKIPEGDCVKIEEAASGRILWEKAAKINPEWKIYEASEFSHNDYTEITALHMMSEPNKMLSVSTCKTAAGISTISHGPIFSCEAGSYKLSNFLDDTLSGRIPLAVSDGYNYGVSVLREYGTSRSGDYMIARASGNNWDYGRDVLLKKNINAPNSESGVKISYSPERQEYLITGVSGGSFTVPENFNSSTEINYSGILAERGLWVPKIGKYVASLKTSTNAGSVLLSEDGMNWTEKRFRLVELKGGLNFCWVDSIEKLCAVSEETGRLALSSDGETWELISAPFDGALSCAYSPDEKVFCALNKTCAYLTRDFVKWTEAPLPEKLTVNFREIIHCVGGIFASYEYRGDKLFFLTTGAPIR